MQGWNAVRKVVEHGHRAEEREVQCAQCRPGDSIGGARIPPPPDRTPDAT
jgi:hypothetical protein